MSRINDQNESATPVIDALRVLLPRATAETMKVIEEGNPFRSDADMLVQFFAAMTWEMDTADIAELFGISEPAAAFIESHLVAAALVPQASLSDEFVAQCGDSDGAPA